MPILGAHMSIAGGYYKAVEAAARLGMDTCQVFTKSNSQWRAKELTDDDANKFRTAAATHNMQSPIAHASYLINLASPDDALWRKSIEAFVIELQRAAMLGLMGVVLHPGSFTTSSEAEGLARVAEGLNQAHNATPSLGVRTLLENTAGQGTNLGWKLEHLASITASVESKQRMGVCFDTCHAFAAGYALQTQQEYEETMQIAAETVGIEAICAFHLNDSLREAGSRRDRHANIGLGHMGLEPFRHLVNDGRFASIPMFLETPKKAIDGEDGDIVNLRTLQSLIGS